MNHFKHTSQYGNNLDVHYISGISRRHTVGKWMEYQLGIQLGTRRHTMIKQHCVVQGEKE